MSSSPPPSVLEELQEHLEGLRRTPDGAFLYRMIARGLQKYGGAEGLGDSFIGFLHTLLGKYARDPKGNPVTRVKARLIQQRLAVHVPAGHRPSPRPTPARDPVPEVPAPDPGPAAPPRPPVSTPAPARTRPAAPAAAPRPRASPPRPPEAPAAPPAEDSPARVPEIVHQRGPVPPSGPKMLAEKIAHSMTRSQEFNALLRSNLKALQLAETGDDLMDLKQLLVRGLEELVKGQEDLGQDLAETGSYIENVEHDHRRLSARLNKLAKHSLNDELTGLPRRRALLRQMEAEMSRAKRYGFSLALSILDIDDLSGVNTEYGRDAGDEVLSYYAREVLSGFRSYDMVARFDGDEFAVLFPNTQREGAERALNKARQRADGVVIHHNGRNIPLPGFSSVLALYSQGEKADALLKRAHEALDLAKLRGKGQSIVSLPTR